MKRKQECYDFGRRSVGTDWHLAANMACRCLGASLNWQELEALFLGWWRANVMDPDLEGPAIPGVEVW